MIVRLKINNVQKNYIYYVKYFLKVGVAILSLGNKFYNNLMSI